MDGKPEPEPDHDPWDDRLEAIAKADAEAQTSLDAYRHLKRGSVFVLDDPAELDPIWGADGDVAWASGEGLIVCGPTGVGKTTLTNQLIAGRLGITDRVLGWPVKPAGAPVLLLAMDRPRQARRALRRLFEEEHRELLDAGLVVWEGPLPHDMGKHPEALHDICERCGAGTVVIDSLKDAAVKLTDDEIGGNVNRAMQIVIAEGIEVVALHHQRKGQGGSKPKTLEDVYGSTWLTAGAGSVILLWGAAGDPIVELSHLKQPANELGPFKLEIDHDKGSVAIWRGFDALRFLSLAGDRGVTVGDASRAQWEHDPSENETRKTRRLLEGLVNRHVARRTEPVEGGPGGTTPGRYFVLSGGEKVTGAVTGAPLFESGHRRNGLSPALEEISAGQPTGASTGATGAAGAPALTGVSIDTQAVPPEPFSDAELFGDNPGECIHPVEWRLGDQCRSCGRTVR